MKQSSKTCTKTELKGQIFRSRGGGKGRNGKDGANPRIGENGNWWVGDTDTGCNAARIEWERVDSEAQFKDTRKMYVLNDGSCWTWSYTEDEGGFKGENLADPASPDWKEQTRLNASNGEATTNVSNAFVSNYIEARIGQYVYVQGVYDDPTATGTAPSFKICPFNADKSAISANGGMYITNTISTSSAYVANQVEVLEGNVYKYLVMVNGSGQQLVSAPAYIRVCGLLVGSSEDVIISYDPIVRSEGFKGYAWVKADFKLPACECAEDVARLKSEMRQANARLDEMAANTSIPENAPVWYAFGDSITEGYVGYVKEDGTPSCKLDLSKKQSWVYTTAERRKLNVTNYGVGGTGYAYGNPNAQTTAREQVDAVDFTNCDLVTFAWGCNDWKYNVGPAGSKDDDKDTDTTPCASLKWCIERVLAQNPFCKIIVITPINVMMGTFEGNYGLSYKYSRSGTLQEFFDAVVGVCEYYGIEYVDMTHASVVNRANIASLLPDGVHPNAETYAVMGREIAARIGF